MSGYLSCCCKDEPSPCTCQDAGDPFAEVMAFIGISTRFYGTATSCESCGSYPTQSVDSNVVSEYSETAIRLECDGYSSFTLPNNADDRSGETLGSYVRQANQADLYSKRCGCCPPGFPNQPGCNPVWLTNLNQNAQFGYTYADSVAQGLPFPTMSSVTHVGGQSLNIPDVVLDQYERRFGGPLGLIDSHFYKVFNIEIGGRDLNGTADIYNRSETCNGVNIDSGTFPFAGGVDIKIRQINYLGESCDIIGDGEHFLTYVESGRFAAYEPADPFGKHYGILPYEGTSVVDFSVNCPTYTCGIDCPDVGPSTNTDIRTSTISMTGGVILWQVEP